MQTHPVDKKSHYGGGCRTRLRCPPSQWYPCASLETHCCGCCCCCGCCGCFGSRLSQCHVSATEDSLQATEANLHGASACALAPYPDTPTDGVRPKLRMLRAHNARVCPSPPWTAMYQKARGNNFCFPTASVQAGGQLEHRLVL